MSVVAPLSAMIDATLVKLLGTLHDQINSIDADIAASTANAADSVQLVDAVKGAVPGALIVVDDETMYVRSADPATNILQVYRGWRDTDPVSHTAGAIVTVNPLWPRGTVMDALRDELRSWGPQLYRVLEVDLTLATWQRGYDLGSIGEVYFALSARSKAPQDVGQPAYALESSAFSEALVWPRGQMEIDFAAPTTDFPSGQALYLMGPMLPQPPGVLHVVFAAPYDVDTSWAEDTDLVADVGLDSQDLDIPPLGVAARLLLNTEVRRTQTNVQGAAREPQDVPLSSILQAAESFKREKQSRINDARKRLAGRFPVYQSVYG